MSSKQNRLTKAGAAAQEVEARGLQIKGQPGGFSKAFSKSMKIKQKAGM